MNVPGFSAEASLRGRISPTLRLGVHKCPLTSKAIVPQAGEDIKKIDDLVKSHGLSEEAREALHRMLKGHKVEGGEVPSEELEQMALELEDLGGKYLKGGGRGRPRPPRGGRQRGAAHLGTLLKIAAILGLTVCELECAKAYAACLDKAGAGQDTCNKSCSGLKGKDFNDCVDNCTWSAELDMAICATNYAICGLTCLLPFSWW